MTAKGMVDNAPDSWAKAVVPEVKACNSKSHSALVGGAPEDVKGTSASQYKLEKRSGFDVASNANINGMGRIEKLQALGAFRILLPRSAWAPAGLPRYSESAYEFLHIFRQDVKAADGATAPRSSVLPAPICSGDFSVPGELKAGRLIRDQGARQA